MQAIHHAFDVAAPPAQVYDALTTTAGLAGWWTTDVKGAAAQVGGVVGFTFRMGFDPAMRVRTLEPGLRVVWEFVDGHPNWQGSTFEFQLEPSAAGTRVRFWQHYGRSLSDDDFGVYNYNWGYYLESLRLLCESGQGKPFEPEGRVSAAPG
jgi:uncharacterized protein YndB with AHSA1/START domain